MGKARYTFLYTSGKIVKKTMSPQKAEKFGAKKNVKLWGLSSKVVTERKRKRRK